MDLSDIAKALSLAPDASGRAILDRIQALRAAAGEDDLAEMGEADLVRRGEHERVRISGDGAVVSLYYPLKSGTEVIEDLLIRRPTAKHIRRMQAAAAKPNATGIDRGLMLLCDTTGRAQSELEDLDAADLTLCLVVANFLQQPPPRTGSKS